MALMQALARDARMTSTTCRTGGCGTGTRPSSKRGVGPHLPNATAHNSVQAAVRNTCPNVVPQSDIERSSTRGPFSADLAKPASGGRLLEKRLFHNFRVAHRSLPLAAPRRPSQATL